MNGVVMADLWEDVHPIVPTGDSLTKAPLEKLCNTAIAPEGVAGRFYADPAKTFVMSYLSKLVADGHADWNTLDNGDIKLQFHSGETFILGDATILRVTRAPGSARFYPSRAICARLFH